MTETLTEAEKEIVDWLDNLAEQQYYVEWDLFEEKVNEVLDVDSREEWEESDFSFHLIGVTVIPSSDGEGTKYPIRDLHDGITRGYSRD